MPVSPPTKSFTRPNQILYRALYPTLYQTQCVQTDLPYVHTKNSKVIVLVQVRIRLILWIIYLWMYPLSLIGWIINLFRFPFTLREGEREREIKCKRSVSVHEVLLPWQRETTPTLYSGLEIMGGSHSPSVSSSQSSGLVASGSGICSGLSQSWIRKKNKKFNINPMLFQLKPTH